MADALLDFPEVNQVTPLITLLEVWFTSDVMTMMSSCSCLYLMNILASN